MSQVNLFLQAIRKLFAINFTALMRVYVLPDCRLWIATSQVHELDHWSNNLRITVYYKLRAKSQDMFYLLLSNNAKKKTKNVIQCDTNYRVTTFYGAPPKETHVLD